MRTANKEKIPTMGITIVSLVDHSLTRSVDVFSSISEDEVDYTSDETSEEEDDARGR